MLRLRGCADVPHTGWLPVEPRFAVVVRALPGLRLRLGTTTQLRTPHTLRLRICCAFGYLRLVVVRVGLHALPLLLPRITFTPVWIGFAHALHCGLLIIVTLPVIIPGWTFWTRFGSSRTVYGCWLRLLPPRTPHVADTLRTHRARLRLHLLHTTVYTHALPVDFGSHWLHVCTGFYARTFTFGWRWILRCGSGLRTLRYGYAVDIVRWFTTTHTDCALQFTLDAHILYTHGTH